jgi:hypothetical protein
VSDDFEVGAPKEADVYRPEDWLTASETIRYVRAASALTARFSIAKRAHAGLLRARADTLIFKGESYPDAEVPKGFWWAEGGDALEQNWELGDFATWIDYTDRIQAFGVRFHRGDLAKMIPGGLAAEPPPSVAHELSAKRGRPLSELWPEWVAELTLYLHENGTPAGDRYQGTDELIATVADRLAKRGLQSPSRSTVQETVRAVLLRLRAAGN